MAYGVFFSHGTEDEYICRTLMPKLQKAGVDVFLDSGRVQHGENYRDRIFRELSRCRELLVLLTASSIRRPWVAAEIGLFVNQGKPVVPMKYGVNEIELVELGLVSLIGDTRIAHISEFDNYITELELRAKG